jgi:hypothetical protein
MLLCNIFSNTQVVFEAISSINVNFSKDSKIFLITRTLHCKNSGCQTQLSNLYVVSIYCSVAAVLQGTVFSSTRY